MVGAIWEKGEWDIGRVAILYESLGGWDRYWIEIIDYAQSTVPV
jgi:hypothetical protein